MARIDLIHVSAGTNTDWYSFVLMHPGIFQREGENANLAEEIRKHVKTPVVSVGAFTDPDFMEAFLEKGGADAIALGRSLIADPFLPKKVMRHQIEDIRPCLRCGECQGGMMAHHCMRCTVNPLIGREREVFHPGSGTPYRKNHDRWRRTGRYAGGTDSRRARSSGSFI